MRAGVGDGGEEEDGEEARSPNLSTKGHTYLKYAYVKSTMRCMYSVKYVKCKASLLERYGQRKVYANEKILCQKVEYVSTVSGSSLV
jgi:hypothetical protein